MARPAIDPMFRSAARTYGSDVIGVILTGGLNDGSARLFEVKAQGGTAIVQDPADAVGTSMPQSAISNVEVDYVMCVPEIAPLLIRLVSERSPTAPRQDGDHASGVLPGEGL